MHPSALRMDEDLSEQGLGFRVFRSWGSDFCFYARARRAWGFLGGSWDLVTRVIIKVTVNL